MSSVIKAYCLQEGYFATNKRNDEIVCLILKCKDTYEEMWIVESENRIYSEFASNLENPYYYGD